MSDGMIRVRVAVILKRGEEILLVKHSKGGRQYWVLPGGAVEYGESLAEAAVREVKEETNLSIKIEELVFVSDGIPANKARHVVDFFFTGRILSGEVKLGSDAILREVKFVPVSELDRISFYPEIAGELEQGFKEGFHGSARYLGNRWERQ